MKAKEAVEVYKSTEDEKEAFTKVAEMFLKDTSEIIAARKLNTPHALTAVLREQSDKWKAFCRQIGGIYQEDGFKILIEKIHPTLKPYLPK